MILFVIGFITGISIATVAMTHKLIIIFKRKGITTKQDTHEVRKIWKI